MKMGHLPPQFDERIEQAQENDKYKVPKGKEAEAEEEKDSMSEAQDDEENDSGSEGQDDDEEVLRVLGIHLGTTNSCVCIGAYGVVDNRCLREIIPNDQGNRVTPSWMGFTDSKRLVGEAAKNQAAVNSERTVFDIKRLIGRKFEDKEVQEVRKLVPYQIVNKDGKPYIQVKIKDGETKVFSPVEISAMIFTKMKEIAEAYSELEIKDAVVSIPAYFNDAQRQATKDAGFLAGLNVIKTIEEPYAVDFAYDLEEKGVAKNILVFHLGGGTCEVSVLYISDEEYEILSQNGDTNFGGNDFDERVVNHFINIMKNKYGKDISKDKMAVSKLRAKCERAKRSLSSRDQVRIKSISLTEGVEEFSETLTRASFEELNKDLFEKILGFVERALDDASLKKKEIDVLALVGGSSWIPKVQQLLTNFFGGKEPLVGDPDFVAAHGAARCGIALLREARDLAAQENKNMEVDDLSKT